MREKKQLAFYTKNNRLIIDEFLKNENSTGYVQIFADNKFKLIPNSIKFIKGNFDKSEFVKLKDILYHSENQTIVSNIKESEEDFKKRDKKIIDAGWLYCEVLWFDNKTKWQIKDLMLEVL